MRTRRVDMNTVLAVGASVIALAFTSACSKESPSESPAPSSSTQKADEPTVKLPEGPATALLLTREDFPAGNGTFTIEDKLKLDKDKADKSKPEKVNPPGCYEFISEGDGDYDRARAKYDSDTVMAESSVGLGIKQSFDDLAKRAQECASVQMEGDGVAMKAHVSISDLPGASAETKLVKVGGLLGPEGDQIGVESHIAIAHPRGTTVRIEVDRFIEPWTPEQDALVLDLLNKQIAKVQKAP
ncbi:MULTISPECIES: hypothetical protein [Mycobacteroides]|uniref:DUF5642 domain-containing protein n=1 Tax=Mycobacteroides chelonae TaxID=1774 RepID=A0AB73TWM5_MYCCH|nr:MULTISPECIES: hypothetical protein [Mycobacteroides]KRQ20269.1 hypothetical protein AOT87_19100 [Mycobacteroides sp. H003]KRQ24126.1 hypothetical protein AOT86_15225 [Mycobacteroides sp. H072]KRQ31107.1 hypothetical protein AOT91_14305 [Mycobacteroides sp. H092]KRQ34659.1 hypothetical protein AOT84_17845 [Mycobacteroides sp. H002]KRQ43046.1 hypothetical protein AOT92_08680 [Mycobacteroides sp. H101]